MPGVLDALMQTWPAKLAQDAWSGITLPRDVYQGRVDPLSPEALSRSNSLASLMLGFPGTPAGALGSSLRREAFNWPVSTMYGKTVDMPITVNPGRSDVAKALANAPHGDVRALRAPSGDVYLWPANEAMYRDIATTFDLPFKTLKDLQSNSYLFNKADVDAIGAYKGFDDLLAKLNAAAK